MDVVQGIVFGTIITCLLLFLAVGRAILDGVDFDVLGDDIEGQTSWFSAPHVKSPRAKLFQTTERCKSPNHDPACLFFVRQGNMTVTGRESPKSLYSADLASMEIENGGSIDYEPADAQASEKPKSIPDNMMNLSVLGDRRRWLGKVAVVRPWPAFRANCFSGGAR